MNTKKVSFHIHASTLAITTGLLYSFPCDADNRGRVDNGDNFNDSANICFSVGLQASLRGLDNFTLSTDDINGKAGSKFLGSDNFFLESNGQVTVQASEGRLQLVGSNDPSQSLQVQYFIDGEKQITTEDEQAHSGQHKIQAEIMLGSISNQKAGEYRGDITLTVIPAIGSLNGCGQSTQLYPSQSTWGTIAYEDLYPNAGDADYNDFVVNFQIQENYSANNQLETIDMNFIPIARGAGYNHSFNMSLDGLLDKSKNVDTQTTAVFGGDAEISATYTNIDNLQSHTRYFRPGKDVTIFNSTRVAAGDGFFNVYNNTETQMPMWVTSVHVSLNPDSNLMTSGLASGEFNYRPYLHVNNTNNDIDIAVVNSNDGMIDNNGYPFGILIPDAWSWPTERTSIDTVYPYFSEYRNHLTDPSQALSPMAEHWYQYPAAGEDNHLESFNLEGFQMPDSND